MPDYRKMYHLLFRAVTKAVLILQQAQQECEREYIESEDARVAVLPIHTDGE